MLSNIRQQYGVGQGFFHVGEVRVDDARFRYIYDCGSDQVAALHSCIGHYSRSLGNVGDERVAYAEALFVSHLDRDHVNGLERLLREVQVHTVFLPYFRHERIIMATGSGDGEAPPHDYLRFAEDPAGWFGDRGVDRVVFVRGGRDHNGPRAVVPPEVSEGPTETEVRRVGMKVSDRHVEASDDFRVSGGPEVTEMDDTEPIVLFGDGGTLRWTLVTFVHPDDARAQSFRDRLEQDMGICQDCMTETQFRNALVGIVADAKQTKALRRCYDRAWGKTKRNLTSMCLYSGPFGPEQPEVRFCVPIPIVGQDRSVWLSIPAAERCGWLATGDADLKEDERRRAFLDHYARFLDFVLTLSLPHHGSKNNFHVDLLDIGPGFCLAAAAADGRHRHPSEEVRQAIDGSGPLLVTVTERQGLTPFCEEVRLN